MGRERASLKRRPTNILQQVHDEAGRSSVSMRKGSVSPKDYEFASDSVNTPNVSTNKPRKSQYNPAFADKLVENANYHKKKKEMKNRSASTKNLAKKLLFSCYACCFALAAKCSKCLTLSFVKTPKYLGDWVYKKTKFVGKSLGFAIGKTEIYQI